MIPQLIWLALMTLGVGINLALDGKPREGKYSFLIALAVAGAQVGLLYWGGFFDCFLGAH